MILFLIYFWFFLIWKRAWKKKWKKNENVLKKKRNSDFFLKKNCFFLIKIWIFRNNVIFFRFWLGKARKATKGSKSFIFFCFWWKCWCFPRFSCFSNQNLEKSRFSWKFRCFSENVQIFFRKLSVFFFDFLQKYFRPNISGFLHFRLVGFH